MGARDAAAWHFAGSGRRSLPRMDLTACPIVPGGREITVVVFGIYVGRMRGDPLIGAWPAI